MNDWLFLYLVGIFFAVVSHLLLLIVWWLFQKLNGFDVWRVNLKKIGLIVDHGGLTPLEDASTIQSKVITFTLSRMLSWIAVVWDTFGILNHFFINLRKMFFKEPEDLIKIRYPILANALLEPEEVYARTCVTSVLSGLNVDHGALEKEILIIVDRISPNTFDRRKALITLKSLLESVGRKDQADLIILE